MNYVYQDVRDRAGNGARVAGDRLQIEHNPGTLSRSLQRRIQEFSHGIFHFSRLFCSIASSHLPPRSRDPPNFRHSHCKIDHYPGSSTIMTCPKCGSAEIRPSKHAHWGDTFKRALGIEPLRCRTCGHRFFSSLANESIPESPPPSKSSKRPRKLIRTRTRILLVRRLVVISIFGAALVLFWLFLRYLTTEHVPASDSGTIVHVTAFRS